VIPLFGFLEGDTLGLLILAGERDSMGELAQKLQEAAAVRVAPGAEVRVVVRGEPIDARVTVTACGLGALDRFDVVHRDDGSASRSVGVRR
jgi:hypothetical protein